MSSEQRKSRRRFLADMLFLGGGLTAAGVLAKTQLLEKAPRPVGDMVAPHPPTPDATSSCPLSSPTPNCSSTPIVDQPPEIEGGRKMPLPPAPAPSNPPAVRGRMHIPPATPSKKP